MQKKIKIKIKVETLVYIKYRTIERFLEAEKLLYLCIDIASHQHDGGWYMYHKLSFVTVSIEKAIKQASVQL